MTSEGGQFSYFSFGNCRNSAMIPADQPKNSVIPQCGRGINTGTANKWIRRVDICYYVVSIFVEWLNGLFVSLKLRKKHVYLLSRIELFNSFNFCLLFYMFYIFSIFKCFCRGARILGKKKKRSDLKRTMAKSSTIKYLRENKQAR